ncbi:peptidoglycan-binding domain-containing protein [Bacillus sp. ChL18]
MDERFDEDIYGLKTANAVKRFQSMCGMTADGILAKD